MDSDLPESAAAYHLPLSAEEREVAARAIRLLIADEYRQPEIRGYAREVLGELEAHEGEPGDIALALSPQQMKITHTALKVLVDDLQREQAEERRLLQGILAKLPDEHSIRAITI